MKYIDFYKLSWMKFRRSPNFGKNKLLKIFSFLGYFILFLYLIGFAFFGYYGVKDLYKYVNPFVQANKMIYIFIYILFFLLMYVTFDGMRVKNFMLLPIKKSKIINFHLLKTFVHPVNMGITLMILTYAAILLYNHYDLTGVLAWTVALIATQYMLDLMLLMTEKNQILSGLMTAILFIIFLKIKLITKYLSPLGDAYYYIYNHPEYFIVPLLILLLVYYLVFKYVSQRFYIDDGIKQSKKKSFTQLKIAWLDQFGIIGNFIRNDIRMIWRNARTRQSLFGGVFIFVYAFFIFSPYYAKAHQPYFNKIMFSMFLTGYFVFVYGGQIPAWDSEYYKFMMTQNLNYRKYLEAKWWVMVFSVLVMLIISTVFLYYGFQVYLLVLAMAIFNIGVNIPIVLITGLFNSTPIRLNEKVKAFQNNNFKFKSFIVGVLRLIIPILLYLWVEKYYGFQYGVGLFISMGLLGLLLKNKFLDWLSVQYIKRKYKTIEAFSKAEEN